MQARKLAGPAQRVVRHTRQYDQGDELMVREPDGNWDVGTVVERMTIPKHTKKTKRERDGTGVTASTTTTIATAATITTTATAATTTTTATCDETELLSAYKIQTEIGENIFVVPAQSARVQPSPLVQVTERDTNTLREDGQCEHHRQRSHCKDCKGSGICEHQRQRSNCKDCKGSGICEHQRRRSLCKDCKGSGICEHQRRRSRCKDCKGSGICEHQRRRSECKECKGSSIGNTKAAAEK